MKRRVWSLILAAVLVCGLAVPAAAVSVTEAIPLKYDYAGDFSEGLAVVSLDARYGFIDKTGKEVIPPKYDEAGRFSENLAEVELNGKWGFVDKTGKEVVPLKYSDVEDFSEGLATVRRNDKCGYVDKTGKEVVPLKYYVVLDFSEGFARVYLDHQWGYLAIDGYVPLYLEGGSGTEYIIAEPDDTLTVPTNPTRPGYTFGGWYTDAALTIPWNFNDKVVNTLTLYAKWVPVSSTATTTGKSQSVISLNGSTVTLDAYTLKADNGGDVTYVKLRDVAALLENTGVKFNVDWKRGAIYVSTKTAYTTKNGTELKAISGTDGSYKWNTAPVLFGGTTKALEGIVLTDDKGGGHTFFKLRDLGEAIGFTVDWSAEKGVFIETE